jgi:CheY-like chemotaxis protein
MDLTQGKKLPYYTATLREEGFMMMNETKPTTVLVVDDDMYVLESVVALLNQFGYGVIPCRNGEEALQKIQSMEFDAILTDIKMPSCPG